MKHTFLPDEFVKKYQDLLGAESETFFAHSKIKIGKSIWVNTAKVTPAQLKKQLEQQDWELTAQKFSKNAFRIKKGPNKPGQSAEFKDGLFNLQEISSMLPVLLLDPEPGDKIIDCCAAPGSKTIQLANLVGDKGKILAVERSALRFRSLNYNIEKFGLENVKAVEADFLKVDVASRADKALLDAPCSSEGLIRKKRDAMKNWSSVMVERKAKLQKKLIVKAFDQLRKEGVLVYSVCTLSPEECEFVVEHLLEKREDAQIEKISIPGIKTRPGLLDYQGKKFRKEIEKTVRIYPQDNDTQAFFIAKIRKKQD